MNKLKVFKFLSSALLFASVFVANFSVFADASVQDYVNPVGKNINISTGVSPATAVQNAVGGIANSLITTILGVIGLLVLIMFVWSGLQYILARGDSAKVGKANDTMKWSAIGIVLVFASYIIIKFVFSVINSFKMS